VFEHHVFIDSMGKIRGIGEHVHMGDAVVLRDINNVPFTVTPASSAELVFSAPVVQLPDIDGESHRLDHVEYLTRAEHLINRLNKAEGK
jgi:hypothetical protein